ncbi:hypothetical protein OG298_02335 [Streptomyces sp. NBC_01005]|uniref:hypothetical protein n=1 Tax=unclassified Streptomyces TaxID=2593676 RepID=UPI003868B470|nr:hypothetical protein OG298_02335 [Streptomyces sp. NBC_01005]WTC92789.1 hypothetical protein OH736_02320 [Streptomyces sp. NBC_01650]
MFVQGDDGSAAFEFVAEGCVVVVEGGDDRGGGIESALELGPLPLYDAAYKARTAPSTMINEKIIPPVSQRHIAPC